MLKVTAARRAATVISRAKWRSGLYISPLKALVYDIERNLRAPLAGIASQAVALGVPHRLPRVAIRTGDTPARERQQQLKDPAEILVTTPESLYLLLGSRAAEHLASVHTVIIDEVHVLASSKRGAHLALSLERLTALVEAAGGADPQRIGLSATVAPLAEAARWLGGDRAVQIVDAAAPPKLDLTISVPVPDMERPPDAPGLEQPGGPILGELYAREVARPPAEKGMWAAIYPALLDEILAHRSTIVFVNSRGLAERLCRRLNEVHAERLGGSAVDDADLADTPALDVPDLVRAHHGSVSHQQRAEIEDGLKRGALKAIVATSSLEMGIDMGGVDQVLLVESPGSVARGLQRVGRAGHGVGEVSTGRIFPKFRGDLLECAVIAGRMLTGELEPFRMPSNALDVLAQQIAAHCVAADRTVAEIERLVGRAGPYRGLSRAALEAVLDMLSGRFPSSDFADIRPLLAWDRATDTLSPRKGAAMTTRLNAGTIPDRGNYAVHLGSEGPRIGELDEEMVFETRAGECILLGASTWRVEEITRDRVIVSPAPGEPGKLPFWRGDGPGRPVELGRAVGAFCREVARREPDDAIAWIQRPGPARRPRRRQPRRLHPRAARGHGQGAGRAHHRHRALPGRARRLAHLHPDPLRRAHPRPLGHGPAMAVGAPRGLRDPGDVHRRRHRAAHGRRRGAAGPDGAPAAPGRDRGAHHRAARRHRAVRSLFRENAGRALLLPKRSAQGRRPLWAQRLKAQNLLGVVRRYPSFPVVLETYREALSDRFDLAGLKDLLRAVQSRTVRVHEVETASASPFARSLVFAYVAAYIYEQDAPIAERRARALTLDRGLLAELLGQAELRELIDPRVLEELEAELLHLTPARRARDANEVHDLLRRVGDLTEAEIAARCVGGRGSGLGAGAGSGLGVDPDPDPDFDFDFDLENAGDSDGAAALVQALWLADLSRQRRAVEMPVAGERRWIAAEDAGPVPRCAWLRAAAGPAGELHRARTDAPLEQLIRRYARTHGPFPTRQLGQRLGLPAAQLAPVLKLLETRGELVHGEIRPLGTEPEWCDAEVMRRLRRRTLARARDEIAPVDAATLGRFLPDWHGIGGGPGRRATPASGCWRRCCSWRASTVSWTQLDRVLLPGACRAIGPRMLDMLAATGQIVWIGRGALGARDGRVALYRRDRVPLLVEPAPVPDGLDDLALRILDGLDARGASFAFELETRLRSDGGGPAAADIEQALWDLAWAGLITNDTFAPLRALGGSRRQGRGRARGGVASASGRWSRVTALCDPSLPPTRRLLARAEMLLDRYGIVSREMVAAEDIPGGFGPLYKVLSEMEETGRVRRGYFLEGLSGAQFARSGTVDRLRAAGNVEAPLEPSADDVVVLPAVDPANPWGGVLAWPETGSDAPGARPRRVAGAWLLSLRGRPLLYLSASRRHLVSFPAGLAEPAVRRAAFDALQRLPRQARRGSMVIEKIDGAPAVASGYLADMLASGFVNDYRGLAAEAYA
jgi:ATP-dependent helicase Lhr and Lhr-like helicase